jgi:flagellar hook-length control protein FliK
VTGGSAKGGETPSYTGIDGSAAASSEGGGAAAASGNGGQGGASPDGNAFRGDADAGQLAQGGGAGKGDGQAVAQPSQVAPTAQPAGGGAESATQAAPTAAAQPVSQPHAAQPSPANAQLPLHDAPSAQDEANVGRVSRGLQAAVNQRGGTVTLRLHPPEMGFLRIEMSVKDGVVTARMSAEMESARTLLQSQVAQLRHALQSQGLSVDRLEVQTLTNTQQPSFSSRGDDSQQAAHDGRSRGRFDGSGAGGGREQRGNERGGRSSFRDAMGEAAG